MLDVHAPEHPIHGIRDFFIHLLTITVGLLIALGLENVAEWRHHLHLRHEAVENMHREIEGNRKDLAHVVAAIPAEEQQMKLIAIFLQTRIAGKTPKMHNANIGIEQATLQDASWNTASVTGALSYMEYAQVQRFASAYQLQKKFDGMQDQAVAAIVGSFSALTTGDPTKMSPAEATTTLGNVRLTIGNLETIREVGRGLDELYGEALKEE